MIEQLNKDPDQWVNDITKVTDDLTKSYEKLEKAYQLQGKKFGEVMANMGTAFEGMSAAMGVVGAIFGVLEIAGVFGKESAEEQKLDAILNAVQDLKRDMDNQFDKMSSEIAYEFATADLHPHIVTLDNCAGIYNSLSNLMTKKNPSSVDLIEINHLKDNMREYHETEILEAARGVYVCVVDDDVNYIGSVFKKFGGSPDAVLNAGLKLANYVHLGLTMAAFIGRLHEEQKPDFDLKTTIQAINENYTANYSNFLNDIKKKTQYYVDKFIEGGMDGITSQVQYFFELYLADNLQTPTSMKTATYNTSYITENLKSNYPSMAFTAIQYANIRGFDNHYMLSGNCDFHYWQYDKTDGDNLVVIFGFNDLEFGRKDITTWAPKVMDLCDLPLMLRPGEHLDIPRMIKYGSGKPAKEWCDGGTLWLAVRKITGNIHMSTSNSQYAYFGLGRGNYNVLWVPSLKVTSG